VERISARGVDLPAALCPRLPIKDQSMKSSVRPYVKRHIGGRFDF
jgi:hypothetical protein